MRILVCGGRHYNNYKKVEEILSPYISSELLIIEGGARGADYLAARFAINNKLAHIYFPAQWNLYGKSAGMIRNRQMLVGSKPDLVIAFPGGKGTANMVSLAKKAKVKVIEIDS